MPDSAVGELDVNAALLGHAQCGPEVRLHGEGRDFVLLLFDGGFIGQTVHSRVDLFLGGCGVVEDVAGLPLAYFSLILRRISASVSIFCLPASMKTVVFDRGLA